MTKLIFVFSPLPIKRFSQSNLSPNPYHPAIKEIISYINCRSNNIWSSQWNHFSEICHVFLWSCVSKWNALRSTEIRERVKRVAPNASDCLSFNFLSFTYDQTGFIFIYHMYILSCFQLQLFLWNILLRVYLVINRSWKFMIPSSVAVMQTLVLQIPISNLSTRDHPKTISYSLNRHFWRLINVPLSQNNFPLPLRAWHHLWMIHYSFFCCINFSFGNFIAA